MRDTALVAAIAGTVPLDSNPTLSPRALAADPGSTIRGEHTAGAAAWAGTTLGSHYALDRTLGVGGTAIVRAARQFSLDREVAIKAPLADDPSTGAAARLLQEAWVTGWLEHPAVVPVHDVATDESGVPHIVMRRIEGDTWTALLDDPDRVATEYAARDVLEWHLRVLMTVCAALTHAHGRGVVHRDLKPDNVMVGAAGEVYVVDWGIAAALDERAAHHLPRADSIEQVSGTPRFMAPEMVNPAEAPQGVHTDVYLLGGLLHAVLAGDGPHLGPTVAAVLAGVADFVPSFSPETPGGLAQLCTRALAREPSHRPASAEAFRRGIQDFLDDRLGTARARWALEHGDARAAAHELDTLANPEPELRARVEAALAAESRQAEAARRLAADHDPAAGVRTRVFVTVVVMGLHTVVPLALWRWGPPPTARGILLVDAAFLGLALALWAWARESLGRTVMNRALTRGVVATPALGTVLALGAGPLDLPPGTVIALHLLLAAAMCAALAAAVEPVLFLAAGVYALGFLVASGDPSAASLVLGAGNAALLAVVLARWGPGAAASWRQLRAEKRGRRADT